MTSAHGSHRGWPAVETLLADPAAERARLLGDLATAYRLFGALRWGELGDGHITCRDTEKPDHMWLLRHRVVFERAQPSDLVLVAPDGSAVDQDGRPARINNTAYHIHHPIHAARPDVTAAAHVHTHWGTPFAAERRMIEPLTQESALFIDDHALFDDEEVQILSCDGGKRIAVALGESRAVILANHGLLTVGLQSRRYRRLVRADGTRGRGSDEGPARTAYLSRGRPLRPRRHRCGGLRLGPVQLGHPPPSRGRVS